MQRVGDEMGADIVKVSYTGSEESFRKVVQGCSIRRNRRRCKNADSDIDILEMVKGSMDAGGAGASIGRNIFQHRDPKAITRAIYARLIHEGKDVGEAMKHFQ